MHRACRIVVQTLEALARATVPGVATKDLDRLAREHITKAGARPAFLGYRGYPATLCISINEEVVHGIPGERKLKDGDVVGLDLGCVVDGFYGDAARTVGVGKVSESARRLMKVTEQSLRAGIEKCRPGNRVGDIG
ncbi:MAG: type I methionyl aminopeptidase, partial [Acidobacteria bacterium]